MRNIFSSRVHRRISECSQPIASTNFNNIWGAVSNCGGRVIIYGKGVTDVTLATNEQLFPKLSQA